MLTFNKSGLLVPDGKIFSNFDELENEFVIKIGSLKRKEIFEKLKIYNFELRKLVEQDELTQWINGSFVTQKINPGDIDIVTFIDFQFVEKIKKELDKFVFPNSEKIFGIDGYIVVNYLAHHKNSFFSISDKAYWMDRFTKTRRIRGNKFAKGFLEIKF